ncbi:molybdopterin-containing oxidoreductase family protein [Gordonibacter massiliensis (ex Traore et al. 2017)]|uniref:molybdopterin-containing oxidoreductase family protein n=1 Tax=Gordonibacter massiliensis (ex Traore et al. 2017) TaxID=1841863 RepID=UPI001C8B3EE3|nr:molybdopterin-dependent oxidoreductase [Gordonibacter massiliensis (ex Traore et al. 2017)]MBX9034594.1 molybdopterin-dependent oxidoreductase [Gordonibacter massiliensis (ex Traore et al. 2017)]
MTQEGKLTRRAFLQGTAALGAMAALSGCASQETLKPSPAGEAGVASGEVEVRHAWCQMCGPARTHCSTLCYIKDGRWTNVEGNPEAGNNWGRGSRSLCAKGNAAMAVLYAPGRILYPMKRTGEKGEGKFERCTWDEAMDAIAAKLLEQKEQYGAKSYGVLSPQFYAVLGMMGRRFLNVHGSPNYMHSAICNSQRMFSRLVTIGGPKHAQATDTAPGQLNKTKLLVVWGYNSENSAVNQGNPYARLNAIEKGLKVIDIRPMQDGLASKADIWVPVRPGTDGALAMAFLNVIIGEDLYDHDFVENWCNGFDQLSEHIKQYTPEWASPITGIPVEQIYEVARTMGTVKPMGINIGNGIGDQQNDGHWTVACACLIEAITGNLGIAGGGGAAMVPPPSLIKTKGVDELTEKLPKSKEDEEKGYMAGVSDLVGPETPRWFQTMDTQESGPTTAYYKGIMSILTEKPYPLRCIFGQSSNPLSATRQPKKVEEALKKLDFYVVMDTQWNSSCDFADYVLPACTNYETDQQFGTKNGVDGTFIAINQKIAEPMGESRSDWEYYLDLAVRMGYGEDFWNGDMDACLREQLDGSGIELEELRAANKGIFVERTDGAKATEPKYQDYEKMFASLPNGKVQCYNEWIGNKPNCDDTGTISPLPVYNGPAESIAGTPDIAEEYPLVISDVHAYRLCNHSYYVDVPYLRELQPYPWVKINPATAKQYGIADGDWVKIESKHGWVKMVARYLESIAPDVLMSRRGWWQPCEELDLPGYEHLDGGSEINVLYDSELENFDPFNSAMSKQTLVKISKLEEGN